MPYLTQDPFRVEITRCGLTVLVTKSMRLLSGIVPSDSIVFKLLCLMVLYFDDSFDYLLVKHMTFEEFLVDVIPTQFHHVPLVTVC